MRAMISQREGRWHGGLGVKRTGNVLIAIGREGVRGSTNRGGVTVTIGLTAAACSLLLKALGFLFFELPSFSFPAWSAWL